MYLMHRQETYIQELLECGDPQQRIEFSSERKRSEERKSSEEVTIVSLIILYFPIRYDLPIEPQSFWIKGLTLPLEKYNCLYMANAWKRDKSLKLLSPRSFLILCSASLLLLILFFLSSRPSSPYLSPVSSIDVDTRFQSKAISPFDCFKSPQGHPVIANLVEGVKYPFLYSLSDFGSLPEKPHKNIVRMLKGKLFRRPDISVTIQEVLERLRSEGRNGYIVDVGANVGMASFAAAVMGFKVLAFEPVFENLQRICDGIWLNRVGEFVTVFEAATSDKLGNITFHKLVGRLDNSAVSATGAKLAFKSNEEVELQVKSIPLDEVIPDSEPVILIKIDVQGWEHHVLKGATKLLSRKATEAPYLIYEEDERLLQASNSSSKVIREFLHSVGYNHCTQHGTDAHCTKK